MLRGKRKIKHREAEIKAANAPWRKTRPPPKEPTPRGVKLAYWGFGLFYGVVLLSHIAGYK